MVSPELEFYCEPEINCHVAVEPRLGQKDRGDFLQSSSEEITLALEAE